MKRHVLWSLFQILSGGNRLYLLHTGTSQGIGKAVAELFLEKGHEVVGIDRQASAIDSEDYTHYVCDVRDWVSLPEIDDVDILINNAGTQNEDDIDINLKSLIKVTEKYGVRKGIKSVLNIGSASGHTGSEFPEYCASKGGVIAYTKNVALRVAAYGATCNSLDPGGVLTPLNDCVVNDLALWDEIMGQTPLKRWASVQEIAQWAYFLTVENKFATGQSIIVDGGESINSHFVWPELGFYNWLQKIGEGKNPLANDQNGNPRSASAMWPGAYDVSGL